MLTAKQRADRAEAQAACHEALLKIENEHLCDAIMAAVEARPDVTVDVMARLGRLLSARAWDVAAGRISSQEQTSQPPP